MAEAKAFDPNTLIDNNWPKDIQLMASILIEMGILDFERGVLNQMLQFCHRYLTTMLDDAFHYSSLARKKCVDMNDVKLAINLYQERVADARDDVIELAKQRNSMPLPENPCTLREFSLRFRKKKKIHIVSGITPGNTSSNLVNKKCTVVNVNKSNISLLPKSNNTNLSPAITKPFVSISKPVPTSIIKFSGYLTTMLDDALQNSIHNLSHARKKCVDMNDVKLADNLYQERVLAAPYARDDVIEHAKQINSIPLPKIKSTARDFSLKSSKRKRIHIVSRRTPGNMSSNLAITEPVVSISNPVPTPIIKFSDGKAVASTSSLSPNTIKTTANSLPQILMSTIGSTPSTTTQLLMPTNGVTSSSQLLMPTVGVPSISTPQIHMPTVFPTEIKLPNGSSNPKRDYEEDDDYDME